MHLQPAARALCLPPNCIQHCGRGGQSGGPSTELLFIPQATIGIPELHRCAGASVPQARRWPGRREGIVVATKWGPMFKGVCLCGWVGGLGGGGWAGV